MTNLLKKSLLGSLVASSVVVSGCSTLQSATTGSDEASAAAELEMKAAEIEARAAELDAREAEMMAQTSTSESSSSSSMAAMGDDLLPPSAAPGECYARVWVDAVYETVTDKVVTREASQTIAVVPATYETVTEEVLVSAASSRLETVPATYGTETETIQVSDGSREWKVALGESSAAASEALLSAARAGGIDLDGATPGMCFHEHQVPAEYGVETQEVLVREASETVDIVPAQYEMVEETILVKEASTELRTVPATYDTVTEEVVDKAAHTVWKKGTGPIQRINEATGEIMCLVEVPATYKTITRTVMTSPPRTETVEIPAEYKTVSVKKEVAPATEQRNAIPAEYSTVSKRVKTSDASFVWHEVSDNTMSGDSRTGNQICLTATEPQYKTITRTVETSPASTRTVEIPAEYKTVTVTKLATPASEQVTDIPAEYGTVTSQKLVEEGHMQWRSILCDTNMTTGRIADIQRALSAAGYNPGSSDGVIGSQTMQAVNAFQRDNGLPVDRYLNIETVKALGVTPN